MKKVGLVLEGGALRGMYTAGVLDVLMEKKIKVDGIMGTSAGALFGANYYSKQKGRALRYSKRFAKNYLYMGVIPFLLTGNAISKKFAYYKVPLKYDVFDEETFEKNNKGFYATATNIKTGKTEYFVISNCIKDMEILRATAAIPLVSKPVELNENLYLDGGITDSIPYDKMMEMKYKKIIVVLTRDDEYRKKKLPIKQLKFIRKKYKAYPKLIKALENRHNNYNITVQRLKEAENEGKVFVIRPSEPIDIKVIERDREKLQKVYDLGVKDANNALKGLTHYLRY